MPSRSTGNADSFEAFFENWLARQEQFLDQLVAAQESSSEALANDVRDLIAHVRAHYQEYYEEKSRMTGRNVFLVYSPAWFTPFERTFLWIAGFKPGLACRLVMSAVDDLTEDQTQRIHRLSLETKRQEISLNDEMAKIQESLAAPPLVNYVRSFGLHHRQPVDGEIDEADIMTEPLKSSMENLLSDADRLRTRTADRVMAILTPAQNVRFLAAAAQLQLRIRMLGLQREADQARNSTTNGW